MCPHIGSLADFASSLVCLMYFFMEIILSINRYTNHCFREPRHLVRAENFYEDTVPALTEQQFREQFRLSRHTVDQLLNLIGERDRHPLTHAHPMDRRKQVLLTLWYLGSQVSFRKVAMLFGVATATAWSHVDEVIDLIVALKDQVIKMPNTREAIQEVKTGFHLLKGISGVVGSVDGCHIPMCRPTVEPEAHINRKGFFSINLMAVCDSKSKFIDVSIGWPGSVHDSRVFKNGPLFARMTQQTALRQLCGEGFLVGDAAFQLQTWMMTPFRETQMQEEVAKRRNYNKILSGTRIVIEHAFGMLKGRFRRLTYVEAKSVEKVSKLCMGACVLHNLSLERGDVWEADGPEIAEEAEGARVPGVLAANLARQPLLPAAAEAAAASQKRQQLVERLWNQRQNHE